jgi:hypothetical protein
VKDFKSSFFVSLHWLDLLFGSPRDLQSKCECHSEGTIASSDFRSQDQSWSVQKKLKIYVLQEHVRCQLISPPIATRAQECHLFPGRQQSHEYEHLTRSSFDWVYDVTIGGFEEYPAKYPPRSNRTVLDTGLEQNSEPVPTAVASRLP